MNLTSRDKKTLKYGLTAAVCIVVFFQFIFPWYEDWQSSRTEIAVNTAAIKPFLDSRTQLSAKQISVMKRVPVLELPEKMETQKLIFQSELNDTLKKCRIGYKTLKALPVSGRPNALGCRPLLFQIQGSCTYQQVLALLTELVKNPHFAAVESLQLSANNRNRSVLDLTMTVSTYVK